jgi:hypothetical protein
VRRLLPLLLVALLAATPALTLAPAAFAATTTTPLTLPGGSSPLSPGLPQSTPSATTTTSYNVTTTSTGGGLSKVGTYLLILAGAALFLGIPFFIWYDSRRKAAKIHHGAGTTAVGGRSRSGSKAPPKSRKLKAAERKRRARGKARKR